MIYKRRSELWNTLSGNFGECLHILFAGKGALVRHERVCSSHFSCGEGFVPGRKIGLFHPDALCYQEICVETEKSAGTVDSQHGIRPGEVFRRTQFPEHILIHWLRDNAEGRASDTACRA